MEDVQQTTDNRNLGVGERDEEEPLNEDRRNELPPCQNQLAEENNVNSTSSVNEDQQSSDSEALVIDLNEDNLLPDISSDEGAQSDNSEARASPSPDQQPQRRNQTLHIWFPAPSFFKCTEHRQHGCSWRCMSKSWSNQRQSLERHLLASHQIQINNHKSTCAGCLETLGRRPTTHHCRANTRIAEEQAVHIAIFQCPNCTKTYHTKRGLNNHCAWHIRETQRNIQRGAGGLLQLPQEHIRQGTPIREDDSSNESQFDSPTPAPELVSQHTPISEDASHHSQSSIEEEVVLLPTHNQLTENATNNPHTPTPNTPPENHSNIGNRAINRWLDNTDRQQQLTDPFSSQNEITYSPNLSNLEYPNIENSGESTEPINDTQLSIPGDNDRIHINPVNSPTPPPGDPENMASPLPQQAEHLVLNAQPALEGIDEAEEKWLLEEFLPSINEQIRSPDWDAFQQLLEEVTSSVQRANRINPNYKPRQRNPVDVNDCKAIQRIYRTNRRKAVRLITTGEGERCKIPKATIQAHFTERMKQRNGDLTAVDSIPAPPENRPNIDLSPFTTDEIERRLASAENTSPGKDGIAYRHWKKADPGCRVLTGIFNICLKARQIPASWKASRSILIPKPGDSNIILNWRNITLCLTLYKLYTGCLASRLRTWCIDNKVTNPGQKCSLPNDGVVEHNYLLQHYFDTTRRENQELFVAFLDLSDAFGSVPHPIIKASLERQGAGSDFIDIVSDLLIGCTTNFCTNEGDTEAIPVECGVRQGCPISGLLFNLAIEPLLHAISNTGQQQDPEHQHPCLAYADDITIIARQEEHLQNSLNIANNICNAMGLSINPTKSSSIHLSGKRPRGTRDTSFNIGGRNIIARRDAEPTKFLGRPVGFHLLPDASSVDGFIELGTSILTSKLAPWQRLDALKTFVLPSAVFAMRTWQLRKTDWTKLDDALRPLIKKTLNLQPRASNEYIYGSSIAGSCAVPMASEDSDIFVIDSAFKLLTSWDLGLREIAHADVQGIAAKRTRAEPTMADACRFLSKEILQDRASDHQTLWSRTRDASGRLKISWSVDNEDRLRITTNNTILYSSSRMKIAATIRNHQRSIRDDTLHEKPDQGKVMKMVANERASSAFIRDGSYTTFADWRFIHRARLNLLPLNGARRFGGEDQQCRRCRHPRETLPHVINHCMRHANAMQQRHNELVNRVRRAAEGRHWETLTANQQIPGAQDQGRPDLVLRKNGDVIIVDITCPFENGEDAFVEARRRKEEKYRELANHLRIHHRRVSVEAFIVGPLGAYDPANERLMRRLASKRYLKLFRKLCVSDAIRWSRMIYIEHITAARQY